MSIYSQRVPADLQETVRLQQENKALHQQKAILEKEKKMLEDKMREATRPCKSVQKRNKRLLEKVEIMKAKLDVSKKQRKEILELVRKRKSLLDRNQHLKTIIYGGGETVWPYMLCALVSILFVIGHLLLLLPSL